jgi:hypothetical protein
MDGTDGEQPCGTVLERNVMHETGLWVSELCMRLECG